VKCFSVENEKGRVPRCWLCHHCRFSSVTVKRKAGFWRWILLYRAIKFQGKVAELGKSTNKVNTFLWVCPAVGDYLKGGKEECGVVTFQLVKQKSMDVK